VPKYAIHHIVIKEAIKKLLEEKFDWDIVDIATTLRAYENIAYMGAIGPDIFFWSNEYTISKFVPLLTSVKKIFEKYHQMMDKVHEINEYLGNKADETIEDAIGVDGANSLINPVMTFMEQQIQLINEFAITLSTVATSRFIFEKGLSPPLDKPQKEWHWFDMLHYRNTGDFARALINKATSNEKKAFAFGYLSHIATDVVGHGYVNQVVGGPYRKNVQRHVVSESFMDSWKFYDYYGENIGQHLAEKLDLPEHLPETIQELLIETFEEGYANFDETERRKFLTRDELKDMYKNFYEILQYVLTEREDKPPEPPPDFDLIEHIEEYMEDNFSPRPPIEFSAGDGSGGSCSAKDIFGLGSNSKECYSNFFKNVGAFLESLKANADWLADSAKKVLEMWGNVGTHLLVQKLLELLYFFQTLLYNLHRTLRLQMVINGILMPDHKELQSSHTTNLISPNLCDKYRYPKCRKIVDSHLDCPVSLETPETHAGFSPTGTDMTPDEFITDTPFNIDNLKEYAKCSSISETHALHDTKKMIGNAVDFTVWMIKTVVKETPEDIDLVFTNWNLDADRGYAYKQWKGKIENDDANIDYIP